MYVISQLFICLKYKVACQNICQKPVFSVSHLEETKKTYKVFKMILYYVKLKVKRNEKRENYMSKSAVPFLGRGTFYAAFTLMENSVP